MKEIKYFSFDWDDNILYMSTVIHTEKLVNGKWVKYDVSTSEFRDVRHQITEYNTTGKGNYRYLDNDPDKAYMEFRDIGIRGDNAFFLDAIKSIMEKKYAPAWNDLINCLTDGSLFMIITARGHEPKSIRKVVEFIIYNVLNTKQYKKMISNLKRFNDFFNSSDINNDELIIKEYLDICEFIGINSDHFINKFNVKGQSIEPEKFKAFAIEYFVNKIYKYRGDKYELKIGFSDDDTSTVNYINTFIKNELLIKYPIKYSTYNTMNGRDKKKIK